VAGLGGLKGLSEQDRDGHRADASGDRGDEARSVAGGGVLDVADVAGVVAGVEHDRSGFNPVAADELGFPDSSDDKVGLSYVVG